MSAADSNETQNAANNVLDVVTVLVIFFEARLVHALQVSTQPAGSSETSNRTTETVILPNTGTS